MKSAVYCRTRGTSPSLMLGEETDPAQKGRPSANQARLDPTTGIHRSTSRGIS
jgi:hypothetical protein